ncbi:TPR repeat-containing protein DDB_G0287407-like isoform X2 [Anneissia japonica]|uniref:TPR repeat-containing protein DDB_G0287407-like isoform X2 n=1 Tax=Anneissia japonica TaxID=1529436 RepID=UPI001425B3B3|nr:TPR repeat-containing protein DDB_G0287407-like isoform X2 [Anneissia japonica]
MSTENKTSARKIARVFFSSPFGGLEEEREELTKKYWPKLSHQCSSAGYEFVPVDMRWGITSEHSAQAATIAICLRELDRSDIVVGFFGQRYGWHGLHDEMLQKTFDFALPSYPWLASFRDRSVTELEFLHGHLNNPGARPACFFFRDKAYDESQRMKFEKEGDGRSARKFTPTCDGPNAAEMLTALKEKVSETKDQVLALHTSYHTPAEGARLMYEAVHHYLKDNLLAHGGRAMTPREEELSRHDAYYLGHLGMGGKCHGADKNYQELYDYVSPEHNRSMQRHTLVTGLPGSGKTCLLSNFLISFQQKFPASAIIYHFVGASSKSTDNRNILHRLCMELEYLLEADSTLRPDMGVQELKNEMHSLMGKVVAKRNHLIIIIDALNKIKREGKTAKVLYWLPTSLPDGAHYIVSTVSSDTENITELVEQKKFKMLTIAPLDAVLRKEISRAMLMVRGKELSSTQEPKVIGKEQTSNPLYLMILLQELCNFGSFFELDDYINSLLEANDTNGLFQKLLHRLEKDYNSGSSKNIVEEIMCCIWASHDGISENEIKVIAKVSDQEWSQIFFAAESFLIESSGLYRFAYPELSSAVESRYCQNTNDGHKHKEKLINHFCAVLNRLSHRFDSKVPVRILQELPSLLMSAGTTEDLQNFLLHPAVFYTLQSGESSAYDLISYWNSTGLSGDKVMSSYMKMVDDQSVLLYLDNLEIGSGESDSPAKQLIPLVNAVADFLQLAGHMTCQETPLLRVLRLHETVYGEDTKHRDSDVLDQYCIINNKLACAYASAEKFQLAEKYHLRILALREKYIDKLGKASLAATINNLAFIDYRQGNLQKAHELFSRALQLQTENGGRNERCLAESHNNLGQIEAQMGQYEQGSKHLEKALEIYEELYYGSLPPNVGGTLLNLAMSYVRLPDKSVDEICKIFQRSVDIRRNAFGEEHPDVAESLMSYGAQMMRMDLNDKALEMTLQALQVFKRCHGDEHQDTVKALENVAISYMNLQDMANAHTYYQNAGEILEKQGRLNMSAPGLNNAMIQHYYNTGDYANAKRSLLRVLQTDFATDQHFSVFALTLQQLPPEEQTNVMGKYSVDAGLRKFPNSQQLLGIKIRELSPTGDADTLLSYLTAGEFDASVYSYCYSEFVKNEQRENGIKILESAAEKFPDDVIILENLAKWHAFYNDYASAIAVLDSARSVDPEDLNLLLLHGRLHALSGNMNSAKAVFKSGLDSAREKDATDMIETFSTMLNGLEGLE